MSPCYDPLSCLLGFFPVNTLFACVFSLFPRGGTGRGWARRHTHRSFCNQLPVISVTATPGRHFIFTVCYAAWCLPPILVTTSRWVFLLLFFPPEVMLFSWRSSLPYSFLILLRFVSTLFLTVLPTCYVCTFFITPFRLYFVLYYFSWLLISSTFFCTLFTIVNNLKWYSPIMLFSCIKLTFLKSHEKQIVVRNRLETVQKHVFHC